MLKSLSAFKEVCSSAIIDSFPKKVMAILMLMLFKYLIYVLYMGEDINLMEFLSLMFFWAL
jgi:hypothetical protein